MSSEKKHGIQIICLLLCLILTLSLFACGTTESTSKSTTESATESATSTNESTSDDPSTPAYEYTGSAPISDETATITILTTNDASKILGFTEMAWWQEVMAKANVDLIMDEIDSSSYADVIRPRLAAAVDLPDIVQLPGRDDDMSYVRSGIFIELTDYYDEFGYNFNKQFEEHTMLKSSITTPDGKIYYTPYIFTTANNSRCLMINNDFVKSVGMDISDIKTIDDYYDYLVAVSQNDTNNNDDPNDEVPLFMRAGMIQLWGMYWGLDLVDSGGFQREANGEVICGYADERYREMLTFFNRLYDEKLLYSEFATANFDTQNALFANNQIGSLIHFVSNCTGYSQRIDPEWDFFTDEPIIQPVVPLTGPYDDQYVYGRDALGTLFGITRFCEDPETVFKFIDYLFSEEVGELTWYGIEGVDYERVGSEIVFKSAYIDNEDNYRSNQGYNFSGLPSYQLGGGYMTTQCDFVRDMSNNVLSQYVMNPTITFSYKLESENEVIQAYLADIQTYFSENLLNFIMGTRSLDTWDSYINDLERMNLSEIIAVYQAASDRAIANQ